MSNSKKTLYVGGLAEDVDANILRNSFAPFGDIVDVNLPLDYSTQKHKGFAFIEFQLPEDAADAIDNMDNGEILGRTIRVNLAKQVGPVGGGNKPIWADDEYLRLQATVEKDAEKTEVDERKTVLFVPLDCVGHVNSLISIADSLKRRGYRTVFLFYDPMDGGLSERGHEVYDCSDEGLLPSKPTAASEQKWDIIVDEMGKLWRSTLMDNFNQTTRVGLGSMMKDIMKHEERIERKLELIKPDCIIIDHYFIQPALIKCGKPWARVYSASPLALHKKSHNLPPATLGLPTDWLETKCEKTKEMYLDYSKQVDEVKMELYEVFNDWLTKEHKLDPLPTDPISFIHNSPYLNVYMYPAELDYSDTPKPENWTRCDSILRANTVLPEDSPCVRSPDPNAAEFKMPSELADKPGKLILLSMGTLASGDVNLMKRMVSMLANSPHRFIVARGANWDKYELAPNMWGEKFLPQLAILPNIDLIITHGGNNTITECFYYGVPGFIVCPIFSDQYDNAQRIHEKQLGRRVDPFNCSQDELLESIEQVLADESIRPRMSAIRDRMQQDEERFKAIRCFRDFVDSSTKASKN